MGRSWIRRVALSGAVVMASGALTIAVVSAGAGTAVAAGDLGCTTLGGNDITGTCVVPAGNVTPPAGGVTVNEPVHLLSGAHVNLSTTLSLTVAVGALEMDKNSSIDGKGKAITINVLAGDATLHGTAGTGQCGYPSVPSASQGAQITSIPAVLTTTVTINVGNKLANPPTGSFKMERCSVVNASTGSTSAGTIAINAGLKADIAGVVLSESTLTGTGAFQAPGGGPVAITTGCDLTVADTGVVSSKGKDPGADLVHLEGCTVAINGLVQSTGQGHVLPNNPGPNHCDVKPHPATPLDTACIEVWGQDIKISNTGEVNADINSTGSGGPQGTSYIDLFADQNIEVTGRVGTTDRFSVHADSKSGSDTTPNIITALAHTGHLNATGRAFSATDTAAGSYGGTVDLSALGDVDLDGANIQAAGHNGSAPTPPCGGGAGNCGAGGHIKVRSFHNSVSWQFGTGNVNPDIQGSLKSGNIALIACTTIAPTTTTNFGVNAATAVSKSAGAANCVPAGPPLPGYVESVFDGPNGNRVIWGHCPKPICPGDSITTTSTDGTISSGEVVATFNFISSPDNQCKLYTFFAASSADPSSSSGKSVTFLSDQLVDAHMTATFDWANFPFCRPDASIDPNVPVCPTTQVDFGDGTGFHNANYCVAADPSLGIASWCVTSRNVTFLTDPADSTKKLTHIVETWDGYGDIKFRH